MVILRCYMEGVGDESLRPLPAVLCRTALSLLNHTPLLILITVIPLAPKLSTYDPVL